MLNLTPLIFERYGFELSRALLYEPRRKLLALIAHIDRFLGSPYRTALTVRGTVGTIGWYSRAPNTNLRVYADYQIGQTAAESALEVARLQAVGGREDNRKKLLEVAAELVRHYPLEAMALI